VDSRTVAMGLGFAARAAADAALDGADVDAVARRALAVADSGRAVFLVDSLDHLRRGGRLSAASAALGTVLGVRPLLAVRDGRIQVVQKVRTRAAAVDRLVTVAAESAGRRREPVLAVHHLGDDDGARLLRGSLAGAGVGTDAVRTVAAASGTALITVTPDGENAIVVAPGANGHVVVDDAARDLLGAADVVLAQLEIPVETVVAAASARRAGVPFVLNAAPSRDLPDALWDAVDVLVVNEHEAADLAGRTAGSGAGPDELAGALLARVPAVVVTLGGDGCLVARRDQEPVRLAGRRVDVVDTTGAGDAFCGVLAAELARGTDLVAAARVGGVAGALAVTRPGAQDAVPERAEVLAALDAAG
uniref:PfkB family carbohydrate kinase n=1 Tax=Cellulosimicrobium cellulans TaxID=1710 RepID=UPI000848461F